MPLLKGKANVGRNISMLEGEGRKKSQAIAIALAVARRKGKAAGGPVEGDGRLGQFADRMAMTQPSAPPRLPNDLTTLQWLGHLLSRYAAGGAAKDHPRQLPQGDDATKADRVISDDIANPMPGMPVQPDPDVRGLYIEPRYMPPFSTLNRDDMPIPYRHEYASGGTPGYAPGGWIGEGTSPDDMTRDILPPRPKSPVPEFLLQQLAEAKHAEGPLHGARFPAGLFEPFNPHIDTSAILDALEEGGGQTRRERAGELAQNVMHKPLREGLREHGSTAGELTGIPSMIRGTARALDPESDPWARVQGAGEATLGAMPGLSVSSRGAPLAQALAGTYPRSTALGLAASDAPRKLFGTEEAQAQEKPAQRGDVHPNGKALTTIELKQRQQQMIDAGVYKGTADGNWKEGSQSAWEALLKREQNEQDKIGRETKRLEAERSGAESRARETEATAKTAESQRLTKEAEAKKVKEEADAKTKLQQEVDKKTKELVQDRGYATRALYAAPEVVGAVGAGILGKGVGYALGIPFGAAAQRTQAQANEVIGKMPTRFTEASRPKIAGAVNDVWTRGGGTQPFDLNPKAVPPFKFNKDSTPPGDLYPKKVGTEAAIQTGIGAVPLYEAYKSWNNAEAVNAELREAETAFNAAPTDVNAKRYESAINDAAWNRALLSGSIAYTGGHLLGGGYNMINRDAHRPNVGEADAARIALQGWLGKQATQKAAAKAAKEAETKAQAQQNKGKGQSPAPKKKAAPPKKNGASPLLPLTALPLVGEDREASEPAAPDLSALEASSSPEPEGHAMGGPIDQHHSYFQPRDTIGKFAGGPVYPKVGKQEVNDKGGWGKKYGGVVAGALRTAARYATGGRVGALKSADGGRTDTIKMDVPSGSYILPADFISSIGENNTDAGQKIWDAVEQRMIAQHYGANAGAAKKSMAQGGSAQKVPIMAAGGERAISPEVVAAFGGGNMDVGHQRLDKLVTDERQRHIKTLSRLPAPQR